MQQLLAVDQPGPEAELVAYRRLYEVMARVNGSADLSEVLDVVAQGVVEVLGYGIAAISRLEGDVLVMTTVCGGTDEDRAQILGRRTPMSRVNDEYRNADRWGILRFVPHERALLDEYEIWVPDVEISEDPDTWHPMNTLYAPLYSPTGELLGNMAVDLPPNNRVPDQAQREVLEMYVVQAGIAMFNAQQRERLAEQVRLGEATRAIVASAGRVLDLDRILVDSVSPLLSGLRARALWIATFTSQPDELAQVTSYPPDLADRTTREMLDQAYLMAVRSWRSAEAAFHEQPELPSGHQSTHDLPTQLMSQLGDMHRTLLVPIGAGPEAFGLMALMRTSDDPLWSAEEAEAALEIGRELGRTVLHARLFATERKLVGELKELDSYKGELIATIAHELKSPLTSIHGYLEYMEDGGDSATGLAAIGRNTERLQVLVGDLLEMARLEDVNHDVAREPVDLRQVCEESASSVRIQAERSLVTLDLELPGSPVVVMGDADELSRVVDNLLSNAVKYSRPSGRVVLALRAGGQGAELEVRDSGMGIAAKDLPTLFDAFNRSSNPEAQAIPGTGLGLAITQRIVDIHEGKLSVESELGQGSTFMLRLPLSA